MGFSSGVDMIVSLSGVDMIVSLSGVDTIVSLSGGDAVGCCGIEKIPISVIEKKIPIILDHV